MVLNPPEVAPLNPEAEEEPEEKPEEEPEDCCLMLTNPFCFSVTAEYPIGPAS